MQKSARFGVKSAKKRRLIIVVRADPVICGHAGEARNLAEAARGHGFAEVRIMTWPLDVIEAAGLPTKPLDSLLPYGSGIIVERPEPVGDYRVPDGRYTTGLKGRLIELFADGMETVVLSMYLLPHTQVVTEAVAAARQAGLSINVRTIAEAVGSDITNVVRNCIEQGRYGPALYLFSTYLSQDLCVAVSEYTKQLIVESARCVDEVCGTRFASSCEARVRVSYPAIDSQAFLGLSSSATQAALSRRGLEQDRYLLFLSRLSPAKGVEDLVAGYRKSDCYRQLPLVIAGNGPARQEIEDMVRDETCISVLTDVDDEEKKALMFGCAAYILPSKPRPEFVETFGIALAEKMLVGGRGPVITTSTGGIPEAVGDFALRIEPEDARSIAQQLDHAVYGMSDIERQRLSQAARNYALRFDRERVFTRLFQYLQDSSEVPLQQVGVG